MSTSFFKSSASISRSPRRGSLGALLGLALGLCATAHAVPLPAPGVVLPTGTDLVASPWLKSKSVYDVIRPISCASGEVLGTMQVRVVRETGSGTLDFYYRVVSTTYEILAFDPYYYAGFTTDVDFRTDGLGAVGLEQVHRDSTGAIVSFTFPWNIQPGQDSKFFFVKTDATAATDGGAYPHDGVLWVTARTADGSSGVSCEVSGMPRPRL